MEKLAGHGCNTTSDQKVYTVELSNNIQNQYCGTFYSCKKKKKEIKVFTSSVFLLIWNKGAFYIQNTKYLSHPQQRDLQYCIFG